MPVVVGIGLRTAGKVYFFDPGEQDCHARDRVLVETARGLELGTVRLPPHEVSEEDIVPPLKSVVRLATEDDLRQEAANQEREQRALDVCKSLVQELNLPMRLIDAQYNFDGSHILIHFFAENRVDFRELVRALARELRTRIELRQVGVRDEAKLLGGFGVCGRALCCASFLKSFTPVAINMAKVQGLALNPQKISGSCGRLMCCLSYEFDHYKEMQDQVPRMNAQVDTPRGRGKVTKVNILSQQVEVIIPEAHSPCWFSMSAITTLSPSCACPAAQAGACQGGDGEELPEELVGILLEEPPAEEIAVDADSGADEMSAAVADDRAFEAPQKSNRRRRRKKPAAAAGRKSMGTAPAPAAVGSSGGTAPAAGAPRNRPGRRSRRGRGPSPPPDKQGA